MLKTRNNVPSKHSKNNNAVFLSYYYEGVTIKSWQELWDTGRVAGGWEGKIGKHS